MIVKITIFRRGGEIRRSKNREQKGCYRPCYDVLARYVTAAGWEFLGLKEGARKRGKRGKTFLKIFTVLAVGGRHSYGFTKKRHFFFSGMYVQCSR